MLRQLEAAVAERRYGEAQNFLLWLLANMSVHRARQDSVFAAQLNDSEITYVSTRLVAAICQLFADPGYGIEDETFYLFAKVHGHLTGVLGMSGFGTADHVIQNLLEPVNSNKAVNISRQMFNKILVLHNLFSQVKLPYEHYLKSHPRHILWLLLSAISTQFCLSPHENNARDRLLETLADNVEPSAFDESMMGWLCVAWMHCSYATTRARNRIKATLNQILVAWLEQNGIQQDQGIPAEMRQGKPVMLVINEHFHSGHAMYRCLAPIISALRQQFYLVGMTEKSKSDSHARKHFDSHYYLDWSNDNIASVRAVLAQIGKIKPHCVYYPSVGMNLPTILLSNIRLARFQMMSLGHPASTHSEVMDFCLVEHQYLADVTAFSEKIIEAANGALGFAPHLEQPTRAELLQRARKRLAGEVMRIAIPAAAMKINAEFIGVLRGIANNCERSVQFHFFPYLNHFSSALFRKQLQALLPESVVYPPLPYTDYLKAISSCDIHVSPFPFSSTNSLIDSLLLGIPLVVKQETTTEAGVDAAIVRQLGIELLQPQTTTDDYIDFACQLLQDDELRNRIVDNIRQLDIEALFYRSSDVAAERTAARVVDLVMQTEWEGQA